MDEFRAFAFTLQHVQEKPHFEKTSFTFNNKIFATLDAKNGIGCVKLTPDLQHEFTGMQSFICPVDGYWGKSGWTYIHLQNATEEIVVEMLEQAYHLVTSWK